MFINYHTMVKHTIRIRLNILNLNEHMDFYCER